MECKETLLLLTSRTVKKICEEFGVEPPRVVETALRYTSVIYNFKEGRVEIPALLIARTCSEATAALRAGTPRSMLNVGACIAERVISWSCYGGAMHIICTRFREKLCMLADISETLLKIMERTQSMVLNTVANNVLRTIAALEMHLRTAVSQIMPRVVKCITDREDTLINLVRCLTQGTAQVEPTAEDLFVCIQSASALSMLKSTVNKVLKELAQNITALTKLLLSLSKRLSHIELKEIRKLTELAHMLSKSL